MDTGGERGLLQLLAHRLRLEPVDAGRPHEPARVDKARQLVTCEQRLLQKRVSRQSQMLGVGENAIDDIFRVSLLAKNRSTVLRMLVERGMDLVVEVVQQCDAAPALFVLAAM